MRVLVTGGAGYVGSVSVAALAEAGHHVAVIDSLVTGHRDAVPAGIRLEVGSYGDPALVDRVLAEERIDAVLHCGARSLVAESMAEPALYYRENVVGGVALLDAMARARVTRLVFSSSAAVYGVPDRSPIPDDAPLRPISTYGSTKAAFEGALRSYAPATGLRSVSLRYFNVAGATLDHGEDHRPESHLIPNVLRAVVEGAPVTVFGDDYPTPDGTCLRDYIHVADLAEAHLAALEATAADDQRTDEALALNLGTSDGFSVREVLEAAERIVGRPIPQQIGERRPGDPPSLVADAARARELLGWEPRRRSLDEMIGSAWEWLRRHPDGYSA
jgi:UDP-glucose 4-epimerase